MKTPSIGITCGDPGGIGYEVALKALKNCAGQINAKFTLFGSNAALDQNNFQKQTKLKISVIHCYDLPSDFTKKTDNPENGRAAYAAIKTAVGDALNGKLDAIVTAPISKTSFRKAEILYTGHTSLLASLTGAKQVSMAFYTEKLKTVLATIHVPLSAVPDLLTEATIRRTIEHSFLFAKQLGIKKPKIAMAGLNPHAGEAGLFGAEETKKIQPVLKKMALKGYPVYGPIPADTLYYRAYKGEFDMVISLYHDQGLIPIKLLAFDRAVNVTIGLPFIRTSPDHGTAYDIAYQDQADARSMSEAILLAYKMAIAKGCR